MPLSTGVDLVGASVLLATGKEPDLDKKRHNLYNFCPIRRYLDFRMGRPVLQPDCPDCLQSNRFYLLFLPAAVEALGGRCMVKPSDNAGSRGVTLLEGGEKSKDELWEVYEFSKSNSRNGVVMVEEVMDGPEVSVEAMTVNGETSIIAITAACPIFHLHKLQSLPVRRWWT